VAVYFSCIGDRRVAPSLRPTTETTTVERLTDALVAYLKGPTKQEASDGYIRAGGSDPLALEHVRLVGGVATLNFNDRFPAIGPNGTSAGSMALLDEVSATIFQFPEVQEFELHLGDSCSDFGRLLEAGCLRIERQTEDLSL
jgi:spore germination protein GerM